MLLYILIGLALASFLTHAVLLFTSFPGGQFRRTRYLYSHITLWATGIIGYLIVVMFREKGASSIFDGFNTPAKRLIIPAGAFVISIIAHLIVRFLVLKPTREAVVSVREKGLIELRKDYDKEK